MVLDVDEASQMVRFGRDLVKHFVGMAPAEFPVFARNPERNTLMGGRRINFNTVGSPPNISDLARGRRPGTYEDLCNLVKLNHAFGVIHLAGGAVVEPLDLPVPTRHLDNVYAILRYTDRPVMARAVSRFRAEDAIRLVAIARGRSMEELVAEPSVLTSFNVNSPRRVDEELLDGLMCFCEFGQVNVVTPFTLAGAMAPVSLAGALVEQTAEALAIIAFTQMVRAGRAGRVRRLHLQCRHALRRARLRHARICQGDARRRAVGAAFQVAVSLVERECVECGRCAIDL